MQFIHFASNNRADFCFVTSQITYVHTYINFIDHIAWNYSVRISHCRICKHSSVVVRIVGSPISGTKLQVSILFYIKGWFRRVGFQGGLRWVNRVLENPKENTCGCKAKLPNSHVFIFEILNNVSYVAWSINVIDYILAF